mgnify:CR=1 FL=1
MESHAYGDDIISQAEAVVIGTTTSEPEFKTIPDLDYLQVGATTILLSTCCFLHCFCICSMTRSFK